MLKYFPLKFTYLVVWSLAVPPLCITQRLRMVSIESMPLGGEESPFSGLYGPPPLHRICFTCIDLRRLVDEYLPRYQKLTKTPMCRTWYVLTVVVICSTDYLYSRYDV
ncbi:hypothetical protein EDB92DRAFT_428604 [Lactarius akahatsu]|uniref:Secreted protein n=1 Tax=Lactarius akahatsu TaxID=416441 RepID=A0AAD4L850_9AGAM|nr:hypothetical protein EDB92DRAFT_428604 [Lactarius akahatsu]